ncbi:DNA-processing protein DprA [Flammeovirga sp. SubArs3]|uniref:DNA-processing protein DprA n=1 Tax=Flammeovirga sp. SubArs3 TaxID=2995316 RepID=UPI00248C5827|nr:DNA-processing protein DprA [Flammeovirga sp. SubArs3]
MTITQDKFYELWLNNIPGIGGATCKLLISHLGSAEEVFKAKKNTLHKINGIGVHTLQVIDKYRSQLVKIENEVKKIEASNVKILTYTDKEFPVRLKLQKDAPYLLYLKGQAKSLHSKKTVAIVGSRGANQYGKLVTEKIISDLSQFKDLCIVSGLAYGIDIYAHRAALQNQLGTVGIMANGLSKVYPAIHKKTAQEMIEDPKSGLITENLMDADPDGPKFPARNRIIAGLADVIIVVQAKKKGGALITADIGNSYHKDVFAVPGLINDPLAEGCNNLIKYQKAHLYSEIKDVITKMNWDLTSSTPTRQTKLFDTQNLSDEEKTVVSLLQKSEFHIEEIAIQSETPLPKIAGTLLQLELKGMVKMKPGNMYSLRQ